MEFLLSIIINPYMQKVERTVLNFYMGATPNHCSRYYENLVKRQTK